MPHIFLALGTNLGQRLANLAQARDFLHQSITIHTLSPIYETEPWGLLEQPMFLNQVLRAETDLEPEALLGLVKGIEKRMGRIFGEVRYGPRIIDIDILAYEDIIFKSPRLTIPHPRLPERAFVLVPLADIAPEWRHPVTGLTAQEMLARVDTSGVFPYPRP
ncbi:MAG TPA: 2-amino-4-hydroxy-6-hydroxymethyldihydropteridine diphosphokinase [Anaerolineae bacterium]|nr:2-amino-4-hydroxy-6-hydroxymethyldihydropteridine diphosphokinase [Anaerolineae bacterium]